MSNTRIHIIGPYNTGTNLLHNIITNCDCKDLTTNDNVMIKSQHDPFDKHTININTIKTYLDNPNNLLIIMYKNIYNWLYSIKKDCYHLQYTKLYLPAKLYDQNFPNVIELYNYYYVNYMSLLNTYNNVIFLDYEKIIDKFTSYGYVNEKLKKINLYISLENEYNLQLMKPAKKHGKSVKSSVEANNTFLHNQNMVKHFVNKNNNLRKSVNNILISFYENTN
jgi:hypothetical protein